MRLIKYIFTEFAITSRRIIHKKGFIRRETWELLLSKVESVQVDQGIFARIIGYGAIDVSGTGGSNDPVKLIRRPLEFRMKAQEEIEKFSLILNQMKVVLIEQKKVMRILQKKN